MPDGSVVIKGGRVVDATGERAADVVVADGHVVAVGADLNGDRVLDAGGCLVAPGLVDLHAHLRQPGKEEAETIESGSRCAALGGFTAVVAMPNTTPAIDSAAVVREVLELGRTALCAIHPSGAITVGRAGDQLAPMAEMAERGVRLFTDDGTGVQDDLLMRRAMEYAVGLPHDVVLAQHCESAALAAGGHMHEGEWSSRLGLAGQPYAAEEAMVARDIALARLTGARIHMQHMSTAGSVALIAAARASGLAVSAEATPHHLLLTHAECAGFDPVFKVNPPLRTEADVAAVRRGVVDGTLDAIATDHAPHTSDAKDEPFDQAPPGMLGLEFALGVALAVLELPVVEVLARLSWRPAAIAGVSDTQGGPVAAGRPANLCVIDPEVRWTVAAGQTASRSRNIPYVGRMLQGKVRHTLCAGEPVVVDGDAQR
ncbi:dihydroorotase [Iamia sp.]|uniref:dihydroorotase n=1 Tax=Iamia sp. TaxID=2722710 RepID=UPI002BD702F3|nr:dihydroorotase [Iamia sp.]HXH57872.1 dihydroorotase [Iamia sp.]